MNRALVTSLRRVLLASFLLGLASLAAAQNLPPPPNAILNLNGQPLPTAYTQYTATFTATSTSTYVTFSFRDDPAFIYFSNVSMVDKTASGPNLLADSNFASGTTGWNVINPFGAAYSGTVQCGGVGQGGAGCAWYDGSVQAYDSLSQLLTTVPGHVYLISFYGSETSASHHTYSTLSTNGTTTGIGGNGIDITINVGPQPAYQNLNGTVYADANHNGIQDSGETGFGVAGLYVKIATYSGGSCQSPAIGAYAVTAGTGAYTIPNVEQGNYCLILSTNNTLTTVAPSVPAGWIGTQNGSGLITLNVLSSGSPGPQNFGLFNGVEINGSVFGDTGAGGGVANNGLRDGGEAGISGTLVGASASGSLVASATTSGSGGFTLWLPASVTGSVTLTPSLPSGDVATGGSAGTTGGTYTRPSVTFTPTAGQAYTGVSFGLVPGNTLSPNGAQAAQPGTTVYYAHSFIAGSAGAVTFTLAGTSTPASPGWSQLLYQDSACSGTLSSGDPVVSAAITVSASQRLCLIAKVVVPGGVATGAQQSLALSAAFAYTNASPALASTVSAADVTTVTAQAATVLTKLVADLTLGGVASTADSANPGDTLQYTLAVSNNGTLPVTSVAIVDTTPAYTTFIAASCPGSLPAGITACSVSNQPAVGGSGALRWTFTGALGASSSVSVTYQVKIGN